MANTNTNTKRTTIKKANETTNGLSTFGSVVLKILIVLLVIVLVGIIVLVIYDLGALKMDAKAIFDQLKSLWEKAYVWGSTCGVALMGTISWSSVKLGQLICATNDYTKSVIAVHEEVTSFEDIVVEKLQKNKEENEAKFQIQDQRQANLDARLRLIESTIFDDSVKEQLLKLDNEYSNLAIKGE